MTVRRIDERLIQAATTASREMSSAAEELRRLTDSLPRIYQTSTRNHLLAIADRVEDAAAALGREADRPSPSPGLLRRLAWVGPVAIAGLSGVLAGTAQGFVERGPDDDVLRAAEAIERTVELSCDAVISASDQGYLAPPILVSALGTTPVWAASTIDVSSALDGGEGTIQVRPAAEGGLWVSGRVALGDGTAAEKAWIFPGDWDEAFQHTVQSVPRDGEQRVPPGGVFRIQQGGSAIEFRVHQ